VAGKRRADVETRGGLAEWWRERRERKELRKELDGPRTWGQRLKRFALWSLVTCLVLALIGLGGFVYLYKTTDIPEPNAEFLTQTTFVYYSNGESEIGTFATQKRDSIAYDEMPKTIRDAVVAAENQSFWSDRGIDPKGIIRAAFSNASGNSTQGASTITQQYVKILYLTQERSYKRKVKEAILSLKVQRTLSKKEVLEGYLNTIYFGRGAYGIEAAAKAYFDKPAKDLTLQESAVLASVLNNPSRYDPANGQEARGDLQARYEYVLDSMASLEMITSSERDQAVQRLPKFPKQEAESTYGGQKGHVLQMVKNELLRLRDVNGNPFTEEQVNGGGLRITTTFRRGNMKALEQGVLEVRPKFKGSRKLHVGAASVEPGTGAVRGIYGGQDYLDSQINWALEGGQAGSTFKPFALAAALKSGYALKDVFDGNSPIDINGTEFENQGDQDYGSAVSLTQATQDSINTAYIDLTNSMPDGPQRIIDTANKMGIPGVEPDSGIGGFPSTTPGLEPNTGVALGSQTVSPVNMANGYATIANEGRAAVPYIISKVEDADGNVLYEHKVDDHKAMSKDVASDVSYALQQVVEEGSGSTSVGAVYDRPAAGKTGTATKTGGAVSSSWFSGYTPQLATAVMYVRGPGNGKLDGWLPASPDGREGYFGGNYPAKTWVAIMTRAMEGLPEEDFPEPAFVDGEAPQSGHEYVPPPPPEPTKTKKPRETKPPSQEPSTSEPPATSEPPPTSEPTQPPTTDPSPTLPGGGGGSGSPSDPPPSSPGGQTQGAERTTARRRIPAG
jgi:membrane peptidoglycan carboxypeptidase